ncbi:MAG: NAD(+)/NADH kinase [Candidatus Krumholzibacteriota bacterium]|nr:NAD(+)/NADH kinase [Candidatus Krumholzibacteriota bacterium]
MKIQKLGIVANMKKKTIYSVISEAARIIPDQIEIYGNSDISKLVGKKRVKISDSLNECDTVIAFGGDGTILTAARMIEKNEIPLLGIKVRSLGFLAEDNLERAINALLNGNCKIQERMRLEVRYHNAEVEGQVTALNDVVIHGRGLSRVLHIKMSIGGTVLGEYLSDGVIIATPTGSTAYSLAAGGPIVTPVGMEAFVITPLCPHSLSVRPIVISGEESFQVEIVEADEETLLTVDGQETREVKVGQILAFQKSNKVTKLIVTENYNFYDLVRRKLEWGGVLRKR